MVLVNSLAAHASTVLSMVEDTSHHSAVSLTNEPEISQNPLDAIEPNPFDLALEELNWSDTWAYESEYVADEAEYVAESASAVNAESVINANDTNTTYVSRHDVGQELEQDVSQAIEQEQVAEQEQPIEQEQVAEQGMIQNSVQESEPDVSLMTTVPDPILAPESAAFFTANPSDELSEISLQSTQSTESSDERIAVEPDHAELNHAELNHAELDYPAVDGSAESSVDEVYSTNAIDLMNESVLAQVPGSSAIDTVEPPTAVPDAPEEAETNIAQVITPGQPTRSGPSYIGAGGNIGFGGSTGIGRGNFALFSKLGLTNNFSLRPAAFIGDRTTFLVPVTLDFPTGALVDDAVPFSIAPYAGGGIGISTGDNSQVRPVIVAGVDAPVTNQLTATAGVTVGFFRNTEVGLLIGVGYNFGNLF